MAVYSWRRPAAGRRTKIVYEELERHIIETVLSLPVSSRIPPYRSPAAEDLGGVPHVYGRVVEETDLRKLQKPQQEYTELGEYLEMCNARENIHGNDPDDHTEHTERL